MDEACRNSLEARSRKAVGDLDLFDAAEETPRLGPVFTAQFEGDDACCGEGIVPGEDIRYSGDQGGWIHADDGCERMARE